MSALFASGNERQAARTALLPLFDGVAESERVAVACLKLSNGDLERLKKCVRAASVDYRDILAWAESPRQMRLGPGAPAPDQTRARREDAEEYARWLGNSR